MTSSLSSFSWRRGLRRFFGGAVDGVIFINVTESLLSSLLDSRTSLISGSAVRDGDAVIVVAIDGESFSVDAMIEMVDADVVAAGASSGVSGSENITILMS